jgi:hypothetical protein
VTTPVNVNLATLFSTPATGAVEYALNGLIPLDSQRPRYVWRVQGERDEDQVPKPRDAPRGEGLTVQLSPMEVRAFMLTF